MVRMPGCRRVRRSRGGHRRPAPKWLARRLEDVEKAAGRATLQAVEALGKQRPDHQVQIDVKFIEPIAGVTGLRGGRKKYLRPLDAQQGQRSVDQHRRANCLDGGDGDDWSPVACEGSSSKIVSQFLPSIACTWPGRHPRGARVQGPDSRPPEAISGL
jgi:hypothetical protein